jgi:hypothetical protein
MTGTSTLKVRPEYYKGTRPGLERRRYKRIDLTLLGRFMRADKQEYTCRLNDISLGGANIVSDILPDENERVVVQFEEIGLLEGHVVRVDTNGFAIQFNAAHRRRQKLAAQLTWLLNRHELNAADQRRPGHDRITLLPKPVTIKMPNGDTYERKVLDVSISGASIKMEMRPEIGSNIVVGRLPARVVRHHDRGIGVKFQQIQEFRRIHENFG